MPDAPEIITFGCRLNTYESEVMRGLVRESEGSDLVIVNTCAVTAQAERQARQAIRSARRRRPGARIVVTGCAAQIDPDRFAAMPEVDRVIGNAEKLRAESYSPDVLERVLVNDIMAVRETAGHLIGAFEERTRAFLRVQNGCDHRCTFCIIPYGRGNSRSVPVDHVIEQVGMLAAENVKEVVLSGVDVTSYGQDLPGEPSFGELIYRVLDAVPGLPRLRLSSLDPVEIDERLWDLIAHEPRLMPHLHLSVQAGDDTVLRRMKRRHLRADVVGVAARARSARPDVVFGADLIAGFPTESDAMFERTLALVDECDLVHLHVFPYSERPGTPAAKMPAVPVPVRKQRAARLREAGSRRLERFLNAQVGREVDVLMESATSGRTPDFAFVAVTEGAEPGAIVRRRILGVSDGRLLA